MKPRSAGYVRRWAIKAIFMNIDLEKKWWLWIIYGALYGLLIRFIFGLMHGNGVMSFAFLIITPLVIGAITIYGVQNKNTSICNMIFIPWLTTVLMLIGSAITLMEGAICIAILSPLFLALSSIGGVAMGLILRHRSKSVGQLKAITLLPFLVIFADQHIPLQNNELELKKSIYINAPAHIVFEQILNAKSITPSELPFSITHLIGVPKPIEGINRQTKDGEIRFSKWDKRVNFKAKVIAKNINKSITWHYIFDDSSFPEGSMDDHVKIGGKYFKLDDTTFNLNEESNKKTKLEIVAHYKVNSSINFYAIPVANILGYDFINTILTLYKNRSEQAQVNLVASKIYTAY